MRHTLVVVCVFLALVTPAARADSLDDRFRSALVALDAHHPEQASRELRALVSLGIEDPDVYLDLGIAEAEAMRYGHAIVAFERALSLRPSDETARRGLEGAELMLARRRAERLGEDTTVDSTRPLAALGRAVPERVAAAALLSCAWIAAFALIALAFVGRESVRIGLGVAASAAGLFALLAGSALYGRKRPEGVLAAAVVVTEHERARIAPDVRAAATATLDEGERADVVERHGSYVRLARDGRSLGWVPRRSIGTY